MVRSGVLNVYTEDNSARTRWIFSLILEQLLGLQLNYAGEAATGMPLLNYSGRDIAGAYTITPSGLLDEKYIRQQQIEMMEYEGLKVFFPVDGGDMPFDPFAMAFYLVTRYEEYLPFTPDNHGRFPHTESLAFREGFLDKAVVNRLAFMIRDQLAMKFPDLIFRTSEYSFIPTVDIDIAYAHLGKGFIRTYGSMARLLLNGNTAEISRRLTSMRGKARDPYDNYEFMLGLFREYKLDPVFFILAGYTGPYDRNLSVKNKLFAGLIRKLSDEARLGVHPSYGAGSNVARIKKEIARISKTCGKQILKSRQHFVKMSMPETYEALLEAGIVEDYSMGYASAAGFRAGIASPFKFYNLKKEEETGLTIHPFVFMDTTLGDYLGLEPEEYSNIVRPLIDEVKQIKGTLIGIWHNYALADEQPKHDAFREIIKSAVLL